MIQQLKIIFSTSALFILAACVPHVDYDNGPYLNTAPGAPLPANAGSACLEKDAVERCKRWEPASDQCINPRGINEPQPLVRCSSTSITTSK